MYVTSYKLVFQLYFKNISQYMQVFPANIYILKVSKRNTRKGCEICSKLTIKRLEQRH